MYQQLIQNWVVPLMAMIAFTMGCERIDESRQSVKQESEYDGPRVAPHDPDLYLSQLSRAELLRAPEAIVVEDTPLRLLTNIWRDFMPHLVEEGSKRPRRQRPMYGKLTLYTGATAYAHPFQERRPIPDGIAVDEVCFILGDQIWAARVSETGPTTARRITRNGVITTNRLPRRSFGVRQGPEWQTGVEIEVIVRVIDANGEVLLLRAANQKINRAI